MAGWGDLLIFFQLSSFRCHFHHRLHIDRTVLLYVMIPLAIILLLILQFAHGSLQRINDWAMRLVGAVIFSRFGILPLPLIHLLLIGHVIMTIIMATTVYQYEISKVRPSTSSPFESQLHFQGKCWRAQRNLYLTCLSLSLWYSLNSIYSLKVQLARLGIGNDGKINVKQTKQVVETSAGDYSSKSSSSSSSKSSSAKTLSPTVEETEMAQVTKQRPPATNPKAKKAT